MNKIVYILFLFTLLSSIVHASVNDFCVADLKRPKSNSGYPCKSQNEVTVNDFVFSGLIAKDTSNSSFGFSATTAFVDSFPGINGLGISAARIDMAGGGSFPMHSHPGGTELVIMLEGEMLFGFITSNAVYSKILKPGDAFVIPQGQVHFALNPGVGKASAVFAFSSENPGVQVLDYLLFGNTLSSDIVSQTTLLDPAQVKKLKARFGGSG